MRELSDVMGDAFEARASSMSDLTPGARLATVTARVRRRRVARHTLEGAASLAVVGAVVVAGWFGLGDRNGPPPVATPSPSISPTLAPTPTPTVPDDGLAAPGMVTVDPLLPEAQPLPPGMLEDPPAGSLLVTYGTDPESLGDVHQVIWLVTPAGERYQVLEVMREITVQTWEPGSHVAVVSVCCDASVVLLDLLTGELTEGWQDGFGVAADRLLGANPDGEQVWAAQGTSQDYAMVGAIVIGAADGTTRSVAVAPAPVSSAALSPDGKHVVLNEAADEGFAVSSYGPTRIVDLETGAETLLRDADGVGLMCSEVGWQDDSTAICAARRSAAVAQADPAPADSDRLVTIDVSTGATRIVAEWARLGFQLSDVVAVDGGYAGIGIPYNLAGGGVGTVDPTASEVVFLDADGSLTRFEYPGVLPGSGDSPVRVLGAVDSHVLVQVPAGYQSAPLFLLEARTGLVTELVPSTPGPGTIMGVAVG